MTPPTFTPELLAQLKKDILDLRNRNPKMTELDLASSNTILLLLTHIELVENHNLYLSESAREAVWKYERTLAKLKELSDTFLKRSSESGMLTGNTEWFKAARQAYREAHEAVDFARNEIMHE